MDQLRSTGGPRAGRTSPGVGLTPSSYNRLLRLAVFCPITRQAKGYAWEVPVEGAKQVEGVVLADQVRNLDWQSRNVHFIEHAPGVVVDEVLERISALLDYP